MDREVVGAHKHGAQSSSYFLLHLFLFCIFRPYSEDPEMNHSTASQFSLQARGSLQAALEILVTTCLIVCGTCGNALIFIAVWKEKALRTMTNVFVVNLAVTDFLFSATVLPLTVGTFIQGRWTLGMRGCQLQGLMFGTVLNATLMTMTAISINRFIMIRHRARYQTVYTRRNVFCMLAVIWCYAVVSSSRPFYGLGRYYFNQYNGVCSLDKKPGTASRISRVLAYLSLYANIIVIIRCYIGIYRTVSRHRKQIKSAQDCHGRLGTKNRVFGGDDVHIAKTLFIVIILFGICWFPAAIAGIVVVFGVNIPGILQEVLMLTVCLASSVNPIVYVIRNRRFRKIFQRIIKLQVSTMDPVVRIVLQPQKARTIL